MFCPFVSTPEEDIECKEGCRFRFLDTTDAEFKCEISHVSDEIKEIEERLETINNLD